MTQIIDGVEYSENDVIQMKRLKRETSEITFRKFREKVSLLKKHFDLDVGLIMKIK